MSHELTPAVWEHWRKRTMRRLELSARRLRRKGIRIITEFDEALRLQDIRDEANEWPCRWGGA